MCICACLCVFFRGGLFFKLFFAKTTSPQVESHQIIGRALFFPLISFFSSFPFNIFQFSFFSYVCFLSSLLSITLSQNLFSKNLLVIFSLFT